MFKNIQTENPLEVQILRDISFLDTGKYKFRCNVVIIEPVEEGSGKIRGYQNRLSNPPFTKVYDANEKVTFEKKKDGHGELKVGDEVYRIEPNYHGEVEHEIKKFSDYSALLNYLNPLVHTSKVEQALFEEELKFAGVDYFRKL